MLRNSLRKLNRSTTSRLALVNYNNNTSSCNVTGTRICPCGSGFTCKPSVDRPSTLHRSMSTQSSGSGTSVGSAASSVNTMASETGAKSPQQQQQQQQQAQAQQQAQQQHYSLMELHHEIRISIISLINAFASHPIPAMSLNDMLKFKDFANENDKIDNMISLLENSNYTLHTLLVLNCKRLKEFKALPYICILNPNIANIFNTYIQSLEKLVRFVNANSSRDLNDDNVAEVYADFRIGDLETNDRFLEVLEEILEIHSDNLPILSEGFKDISQMSLIDNDQDFLNSHLKERIMLRLISKHHLLLTQHYREYTSSSSTLAEINTIGMIDKNMDVIGVIARVAEFVNDMSALKYDEKISIEFETIRLENDGTRVETFDLHDVDSHQIVFPYISTHVEYVLQELLKNSSRAQIENGVRKPLQITIVVNKRKPQSYLELRIRDQGKGIQRAALQSLFTYSFTTVQKTSRDDNDNYDIFNNGAGTDANVIAGMGYGLPLSKLYVEMFGGHLELQTYEGWGTDVYIKLRGPESKLLG